MTQDNRIQGTQENDKVVDEHLTKQIAKGGGITLFGQIIGKVLKFVLQIVLTRLLGASSYGVYALGHNVFGISQTFSKLGFHHGVVRFGSRYRGEEKKAKLKGTLLVALGSSLAAGIVIAILLFIFAGYISNRIFNEPNLIPVLKVFAFSLPFYTLMTMTGYSARVFRRMQYDVGIRRVLHPFFLVLSTGIVFLLGYELLGIIYGFLFSAVLAAIIGVSLLWKLFPDLISALGTDFEVKKLLFFSATVLLMGISSLLMSRTDRVMLGALQTSKGVGIYNAASVMATQISVFLSSMNAIFAPIISDLYNRGELARLGSLFKTVTKWIFSATFPLFCVLAIFSQQVMSIFGSEFVGGASTLIVLGISQLIGACVGSVGFILIMTDHQRLELVNTLILGLLNIVLNYIFISYYGIVGAALATGLSLGLINMVRLGEVYTLLNIHPYKISYWKPLLGAAISSTIVAVFRLWGVFQGKFLWIGGILFFLVLYLAFLILFGFDKEDKIVFKAAKRKFVSRNAS